jgi:hypothetical protein
VTVLEQEEQLRCNDLDQLRVPQVSQVNFIYHRGSSVVVSIVRLEQWDVLPPQLVMKDGPQAFVQFHLPFARLARV